MDHHLNVGAQNFTRLNVLCKRIKTGEWIAGNDASEPTNDVPIVIVFRRLNEDNVKPLFYNTKPLEFITLYLFQVSFKQKGEANYFLLAVQGPNLELQRSGPSGVGNELQIT